MTNIWGVDIHILWVLLIIWVAMLVLMGLLALVVLYFWDNKKA